MLRLLSLNAKLTRSKGKLGAGWRVNLSFLIVLHVKDKALLEKAFTLFFWGRCGNSKKEKDRVRFDVSSVKDLSNLLNSLSPLSSGPCVIKRESKRNSKTRSRAFPI